MNKIKLQKAIDDHTFGFKNRKNRNMHSVLDETLKVISDRSPEERKQYLETEIVRVETMISKMPYYEFDDIRSRDYHWSTVATLKMILAEISES